MRLHLINIFKSILGIKEKISFKIKITFFIMVIICYVFSSINKSNSIFLFVSFLGPITFWIWLFMILGYKNFFKFLLELYRFFLFTIVFINSFHYFVYFNDENFNFIYILVAYLGLFISILYFVSVFYKIFTFTKIIIRKLGSNIINKTTTQSNKVKIIFENITALVASITALCIAVKAFIEPIIKFFTQ